VSPPSRHDPETGRPPVPPPPRRERGSRRRREAPLPPPPYVDTTPPPSFARRSRSLPPPPPPPAPREVADGAAPVPPVPLPPPVPSRTREAQRDAGTRRWVPQPEQTQIMAALPPVPRALRDPTGFEAEEIERREGTPGATGGILRAAGTMAVATLVSRVTGLVRTMVLAAALGVGLVNDAYNTSNTLPNIVYELLIGGVLTSVIVPLLVHAQERDRDGGVGYAQRLVTVTIAGLTLATLLSVMAAPGLTWLYNIRDDPGQVSLANWLARILLVEIVFYGVGALATAILNARDVFGPPAWAPVLNNVVVIATGGLFIAATGPGSLTPVTITPGQVWLLGLGTTLGIAVQALVLLPLLPRHGVPLRLRWGLKNTGLREAGTLGLWVAGYVAVSQVGVLVGTAVANAAARDKGLGSSAFAIAQLLFVMPYGIIGVALLTALLTRMSRAAARGDLAGVRADLSLGTRLSALGLLPVTAGLLVLAPTLSRILLGHGQTSAQQAWDIGVAVAVGAFGLLPMAVTLLQLRVFYAMKDARTPTLIQLAVMVVRVPLMLLVPVVVPAAQVVAGLMLVTSVTFVLQWVIGEVLLQRRLGVLDSGGTLVSVARIGAASGAAALVGWVAVRVSGHVLGTTVAGSLATLVVGTVVLGVAAVAGLVLARVPELEEPLAAVRARLRRA
jgi:putative peptidoglycan lipid II flippase